MHDAGVFPVILIKPSHYDKNGYIIQWWRSFVVNNALAVMGSVITDAAEREALGPDIVIERRLIDEVTEVVRPDRLIRWLAQFDHAAVMLVAVQTSQFPRALDITRPFAAAGYPVVIGGVHVSGALAMVPNWEPAFAGASDAGASYHHRAAPGPRSGTGDAPTRLQPDCQSCRPRWLRAPPAE